MSPFVRRPAVQPADRLLARSVLALVLAVFVATFTGLPGHASGELAYQTTRSLARGHLALGATPEARLLVAAGDAGPPGALPILPGTGARAGARYACLGAGHAALGLPFYGVGWVLDLALPELERRHAARGFHGRDASEYLPHLLVGLRNPLLSALTAWLLVLVARRLGAARPQAWLTGLTYGLTTFAWSAARGSQAEVSSAFLALLAFSLILRLREGFERIERPRAGVLLGLGGVLGLAWTVHAPARPALLVLAAAAEVVLTRGYRQLSASRWSPRGARRPGGTRAVALALSPLVFAGLATALLDQLRFGRWFDPCGLVGLFGAPRGSAIAELIASPGRGLLWTAPLVVLVPLGLRRAHAEGERLFLRSLVALTVCTLVTARCLSDPGGRWSFGPRPLLPLLPFLWVAVGLALPWVLERAWRARLVTALGLAGLTVQLAAALVDESTYVDLARQAAVEAWPELAQESDPVEAEERLWSRCAWSWSFAAPWVHWRVLRHRIAGLGESFSARDLFRIDSELILEPTGGRERGFRHLAWVDLGSRLGGGVVAGVLIVLALFGAGAVGSARGLDPSKP